MEIERFIQLAKKPSKIGRQDIPFLEEIIQKYPYFQVARVLLAKATGAVSSEVKSAAAYTTERSILQEIMDSEFNANVNLPNNLDFIQIHEEVDALNRLTSEDQEIEEPAQEQKEEPLVTEIPIQEEEVLLSTQDELETEPLLSTLEGKEEEQSELEKEVDEVIEAIFDDTTKSENIVIDDVSKQTTTEEVFEEEEESIDKFLLSNTQEEEEETEEGAIDQYEDDSPISIDEIENRLQSFLSVRRKATEKSIIDDLSQNDDVDPSLLELAKRKEEVKRPKVDSRQLFKPEQPEESEVNNDFPYDFPVFQGDAEKYIEEEWEYENTFKNMDQGAGLMEEQAFDPFHENDVKKGNVSHTFISETKLKQQHELIDRFIDAMPTIQKNELVNEEVPDAEVVDLTKNNASRWKSVPRTESFAKILVRQGRLNDALDIYSSLKLKYPSKNTYFASRIEKLKKEIISKRSR